MHRDVTKIAWDGERVKVRFEVPRGEGVDEFEMSCVDAPAPGLQKALCQLVGHVQEILELPADYCANLEIRGVSFSYGGEGRVMGATITALKELTTANAPLVLNTPHLASAPYNADEDPGAGGPLLSDEAVEDLMQLQAEVLGYVDGQRMQGDLFSGVAGAGDVTVTITKETQ